MPIIAEVALMKSDIEDLTFELQDVRTANMILREQLDKFQKIVEAAKLVVQNNQYLTVNHPHFDWESLKDLFTAVQELEGK